MAVNIQNTKTGQTGFQVPGAPIATGWSAIGSNTPTPANQSGGVPSYVNGKLVSGGDANTPKTDPNNPGGGSTPSPYYARGGGTDPAFNTAMKTITPATPSTEEDLYSKYFSQSQAVLDAITEQEQAAEKAANIASTKDTSARNFAMNALGLAGSTEADSMAATTEEKRNTAIQKAQADKANALGTLTTQIRQDAQTQSNYEKENAQNLSKDYVAKKQADAQATVKSIAAQGHTLEDVQSSDPTAYNALLNFYGGNENLLKGDWIAAAQPLALDGGKPILSGSHMIFTFKDPTTGKTFTQDIDTGVPLSADVKVAKSGDGSLIMYDQKTGEAKTIGGGNPYYMANQGLTVANKAQTLKASYARQAQSILRSTGLMTGSGGSGGAGSIPAKFYNSTVIMDRIKAAKANGANAVSDEDIIDALVSINTGGGRPTQAQFDQITQNLGFADKAGIAYQKYVNNQSKFLPDSVRADAIDLATKNFQELAKTKAAWDKTAADVLAKNGLTPDKFDVTTDSTFLAPPSTVDTTAGTDLSSSGFTDNGDGSFTAPDGSAWIDNGDGTMTQQ